MNFPITKVSSEFANELYSAHRYALDIGFFAFGVVDEIKSRATNEWQQGARYFCIGINRYWTWGSQHMYYDGPHCSFSIGFLHIAWSWNWCKICAEELETDDE